MEELAAAAPAGLRKEIRLRHAVALYVSSVLGSGVLVLPGLTAQVAGPAALVAILPFVGRVVAASVAVVVLGLAWGGLGPGRRAPWASGKPTRGSSG